MGNIIAVDNSERNVVVATDFVDQQMVFIIN